VLASGSRGVAGVRRLIGLLGGVVRRCLVVVIARRTHERALLEGAPVFLLLLFLRCMVQCSLVLIAIDRGLVLGPLAAQCSSTSHVVAVDVPLGIDIGSSISVNLPLVQAQT
jgi:hypothetical protein